MAASERLFSKEFILFNLVFFVASTATAIFFQFHQYLRFLGISQAWSGFIIAADAIPAFILLPLLGVFLNNNAQKWMFGGMACMIAAFLSYGFATTVMALVAVRIFQGVGFACLIAAIMVLIVNYIPQQKSGIAFGIISTTRLVPYALIPPLMSAYFDAPQDFLKALTYSALPMALSLMAILLLKPPDVLQGVPPGPRRLMKCKELIENLKDHKVSIVLLVNLLLYSGYTTVFFFLEEYNLKMGVKNPGLFFTITTIAMIGVRVFGSALFDKINKAYLTFWSMAGLVVCYAAMPFTPFRGFFYILAFFTGIAWGIVMPVLNALMFEVSAPHFRGLSLILSLVMMQGGFFVGPFLGGLVCGWWGYNMLFYFCATLSLLSAVFTWRLVPRNNR